ncbi:tubulin-like doman-containing protein [Brevibacterium moorei]|uniref:tubulin-like doman-containing protein n=1 Tax=Brevibacterium moorei TaxID=2968457 RepID=UPI00211BEBB2|nr:tubulin-like doman-containing protein [Brevibacterium sp. 68QC2CO]MCQ9386252.1 tubulin-like doman-containing protein [Brevibacterium sp. 68QC2CO]
MFKFLVVGCGGSGGETLARLMDHLKSELLPYGFDSLPAGWQFVHVDVPVAADTKIKGIGNVADQGGRYIGTAPSSGSYPVLDNAVTQKLMRTGDLADFVTWAPRDPRKVTVPLVTGAGQMRAVGRIITLNRSQEVFKGLQYAIDQLNTDEATSQMQEVAAKLPGAGSFDPASPTMVFVVSSMAGGAGASMALDVCRLLAQTNGVLSSQTGVFMYTSDIFPDNLSGVKPNALGMLGEIVAAQTTAAEPHDVRTLEALGQHVNSTGQPPFARVFPVSKYQGLERARFGDGSQTGLYRGLARGLAALMVSGRASGNFQAFYLGNPSSDTAANGTYLGWGAKNRQDLSWGTFGFGRLSLGRDRYRHYAAQRMARTAVDRLREGHLQAGNQQGSTEQLRALVESQWDYFLREMGLPDRQQATTPAGLVTWLRSSIGQVQTNAWSQEVVQTSGFEANMAPATGMPGNQWLAVMAGHMQRTGPDMGQRTDRVVYRWAFDWAHTFERRLAGAVETSVSTFGLPYARELLRQLESYLSGTVVPQLSSLSQAPRPTLNTLPQQINQQVGAMGSQTLNTNGLIEQNLVRIVHAGVAQLGEIVASGYLQQILAAVPNEVLSHLGRAVERAIESLDVGVRESAQKVGMSTVETDIYAAWPSDDDKQVPERFATAHNEVLLTPAAEFDGLYTEHLPRSIPDVPQGQVVALENAKTLTAGYVISGRWKTAEGAKAPGGLLGVSSDWQPAVLPLNPHTGERLTPKVPAYELHIGPAELRQRALKFINRPNEVFDDYCSLSLENYVLGNDSVSPVEVDRRRSDLRSKFRQTLTRALPLGSVHPDVVSQVHTDKSVDYRYTFSAVPFGSDQALADDLQKALADKSSVSRETEEIFSNAVASGQDASGITHIDVFGSFGNLSPLVFDGILQPVSTAWSQASSPGLRREFWEFRRARPLPASLPMADAERCAMIAGWYVAQLTGQLQIPDQRNLNRPVQIYDRETGQWLSFPNPLLTPPAEFVGQSFDWLPAVLESVLLAISNAHQTPVLSSLKPYRVLRGIFDNTPEEPRSGLLTLAARDQLADWLRTGETPSGMPSRAQAPTLEERYRNAGQFLETVQGFAAGKLDQGHPGGAVVAVANRAQGALTPIFCDLVPDIVQVTQGLLGVLEEAKANAEAAESGSQPGGAWNMPEGLEGPF